MKCALEVRGRDSPRYVPAAGRGRGSSVGSTACYLTGLSYVDPVENGLSLGRFLNRELVSVPDIDLDFPRDIREKLIVRVTERDGHEHAALVASFATYRSRGAIRDVGKALGLPHAELERLARVTDGWHAERVADEVASLPDAGAEAPLEALAGVPLPHRRDRGTAAARLAAPGRDGDLVTAAPSSSSRRSRRRWRVVSSASGTRTRAPTRGSSRSTCLASGCSPCVEECVDRIARSARRADRPLTDPSRRPGGVRRDPGRPTRSGVPDREPRADAEPPAHPARDDRRPHDPGGARAAGTHPGEGGAPVHRAPAAPPRGPDVRLRESPHESLREPLRRDPRRRRLP